MWVTDMTRDTLFAYDMETKARKKNMDIVFETEDSRFTPYGIWSDEDTMYVTDYRQKKVYDYNMPKNPPSFGSATVADKAFARGDRIYSGALPAVQSGTGTGAISYTLTYFNGRSLDNNLSFDSTTRRLSGVQPTQRD